VDRALWRRDSPLSLCGSAGARSMVVALMVVLLRLVSNGRSIERMFDLYRISGRLPRAFASSFEIVCMYRAHQEALTVLANRRPSGATRLEQMFEFVGTLP
jgi:hypothetical protein